MVAQASVPAYLTLQNDHGFMEYRLNLINEDFHSFEKAVQQLTLRAI
jgi:hypothetical protein